MSKGYPPNRERSPLPAFLDALMTWEGGETVVRLTLTTGEKVAGALQMSHDMTVAWIVGEWKYLDAGRSYRLIDTENERGIRTDHIISVEHVTDL